METRNAYIVGCLTRSREQKSSRVIILAMATGLVRAHLCSFITDSEFCDSSERSAAAKEEVRKFLQAIQEDSALQIFDEFASNLLKTLEKQFFACISGGHCWRSTNVQKEKIWSEFHKLRQNELPKLWCDLSSKHDMLPNLSPLVCQYVSRRLYTNIIKSHLCETSQSIPSNSDVPELTTEEEGIIRYAAGYVF